MYLLFGAVVAGGCAFAAAKVRGSRNGLVFEGDIPEGIFVAAAETDSEEELAEGLDELVS
jgi:hypothetical protein